MPGEPGPRLDGWKAIADYLGRDVRTAQRWRDERGMPVHRVPGGRGGAVFADPGELDAWLFQGSPNHAHGRDVADLALRSDAPLGIDSTSVRVGMEHQAGRWPPWLRRSRAVAATAAVLAIAAATIAVLRIEARRGADPARVDGSGGTIVAYAADNSVVWRYQLPERPGLQVDDGVISRVDLNRVARAAFRGGEADVIALASLTKVANAPDVEMMLRDEVYCLRSDGTLRWMFYPRTRLAFAHREFAGPWRSAAWLMLSGPKPRLWVSFFDHVWWPSVIVSLDENGKAETTFVNSGHIRALARVQSGARDYVLAGGVNNEYRAAALAVLDRDDAPSVSPQTNGAPFSCDACPTGRPHAYFVFPRFELAAATDVPYEYADMIQSPTNGSAVQVSLHDLSQLNLRAVYQFSEDLVPESVAMSDRYWEVHRQMFESGKLDHAPENCPERTRGVVVRMWRPNAGWSDLNVPPTFGASKSVDTRTH